MTMSSSFNLFLVILSVAVSATATAKAPAWFTEQSPKKDGNILTLSCSGNGPDKVLANKAALDQCRGIGTEYVSGYTFKSKSLSIEDNKQAAWHSETKSEAEVSGLECQPIRQSCEEADGSWQCFVSCRFDLAKAKAVPKSDESTDRDHKDAESSDLVSSRDATATLPVSESRTKKASLVQSENRHLLISTVPSPCDDILVIGRPRVVKCDENPKMLLIYPEDREVVIRLKGYKPKHLNLKQDRKPVNFDPIETVDVYLEKL
ncbi:MAG: hypothetical protein JNM39_17255 [Bdellovibrionaceae bacterium]|nr:hypothetical protein [Pseudobdellovibrionaceae bacterium]